MLFPKVESGGYFIIEELDFPETREDMRIDNHAPDLKTILLSILEKKDFIILDADEALSSNFENNIQLIKELVQGLEKLQQEVI